MRIKEAEPPLNSLRQDVIDRWLESKKETREEISSLKALLQVFYYLTNNELFLSELRKLKEKEGNKVG